MKLSTRFWLSWALVMTTMASHSEFECIRVARVVGFVGTPLWSDLTPSGRGVSGDWVGGLGAEIGSCKSVLPSKLLLRDNGEVGEGRDIEL